MGRNILFVGTSDPSFVNPEKTEGIYMYEVAEDGTLESLGKTNVGDNPGFISWCAEKMVLFVAHSTNEYEGQESGYISAWRLKLSDMSLELLNRQSSCGIGPAHLSYDNTCSHLFVANYVEGTIASYGINHDGSLSPAKDSKHHYSKKLNPKLADRQEAAHPHMIRMDPAGRLLVPDLGLDKVFCYELSDEGGIIGAANSARHYDAPAGSGPRHLDWSTKCDDSGFEGRHVYVILELSCEVSVLDFETLKEVQRISSLPDGVQGSREHHRGNSDIHLHPNDKWLYTTNRTKNACSITVFDVNQTSGHLTVIQHQSTLGDIPRNFCIHPSGSLLFVGNQKDSNIVVFNIDRETGKLSCPTSTGVTGISSALRSVPVSEPPACLVLGTI